LDTLDAANAVSDPHLFPVITWVDTGYPALANQCGALVFNDRVRWDTIRYATIPELPDENPWKYWWRRGRSATDGSGVLDEVRKVRVGPDTTDVAVVEMPLSAQYDAIGVVLLTTTVDTFTISDLPFTTSDQGPWGDVNFKFQHWSQITPPSLTSVTHDDGYVTLTWDNEHQGRTIDSTIIYRNGVELDVVPGADTTYMHESPGAGTWTYALKHVSWPAALAPPKAMAFPNSDISDTVSITLGTACARRVENTSWTNTWKQADQYLSAGCSELGSNKRFRWYTAGDVPLTGWSSDTLFDFSGHVSTGSQVVILKDSNTTTHATARDTLSFTIYDQWLTLVGPTFITDKQRKVYWADSSGTDSTHAGQWFERYDDGPQWYPASAYEQDTLKRIWPYGEYTVDLRQHKYTGVLRRGRRFIEVCSPDCGDPAPPALRASPADATGGWGLFGAGPWLGWGSPDVGRTLRLYDLWGMHDRQTPFTDAAWFTGPGGTVTDPETGWAVTWTPRDLGITNVRGVDLTVTDARTRPYVFSMAVDPDLGTNGGDDVGTYDAARGLVLVADAETALGFLLLDAGGRNALASVQEYGVGRWAPTVSAVAWAAQRAGVHLRGTPGDVQLVLSAGQTDAAGTWTFVVLRGATRDAVRARADEVRRGLR